MKIVKILGGLGNQMYQYAFYIAMKESFPKEEVMLDLSCFKGYPLHNGFELDNIFKLNFQVASLKEVARVAYPYFNYRVWQIGKYILPTRRSMFREKDFLAYYKEVFTNQEKQYFDGYWQNQEYFLPWTKLVRKAFSFTNFDEPQNIKLYKEISSKESLSIHIRRKDYLQHKLYKGICDTGYYKQAIDYVMNRESIDIVCIFSDDIAWCRDHILPLLNNTKTVFVDWNKKDKNYRDMQLMSCCKHNIIANSSFSWWGAWLNNNPEKMVVAPKIWINSNLTEEMNLDKSWIKI